MSSGENFKAFWEPEISIIAKSWEARSVSLEQCCRLLAHPLAPASVEGLGDGGIVSLGVLSL
jgi:hypothetical protein